MKFVVNATLADNGGPLGASPTDPVLSDGSPNPNAATDPTKLALNAEGELGAADFSRNLSLNEEVSESICATVQSDGTVRWIPTVKSGPGFEDDCAEAGGESFGPEAALLGTVENPGASATGVPLMWTDDSGVSSPVNVTLQDGSTVTVNVTENPVQGDTETWSIYNFTEDAHPIHLHLVRFSVVSRGLIDNYPIALGAGVEPWEGGFKDTVIAYPGEITTLKAKFDLAGLYVWHCHILEHEDNEMMRPFVVSPEP